MTQPPGHLLSHGSTVPVVLPPGSKPRSEVPAATTNRVPCPFLFRWTYEWGMFTIAHMRFYRNRHPFRRHHPPDQQHRHSEREPHEPEQGELPDPSSTGSEAAYMRALIDSNTLVTVVLMTGERLRGHIRYYDRDCFSLGPPGRGANIFLRKHSVRCIVEE